jgi:hypothetical protein
MKERKMTEIKHLGIEERMEAFDDSLREQEEENVQAAQLAAYDELVDAEYERLRDAAEKSICERLDLDADSDSVSAD